MTEISKIENLNNLGDEQCKLGNFSAAIDFYKKILEESPDNWIICDKIGKCYKRIENYNSALSFLKQAVKLNPDYTDAYWIIGDIYNTNLSNYKSAITYFKKYLETEPKNTTVYNIIGHLYEKIDKYENIDEQIKYYEKALELSPNSTGAIRNLAFAYSRAERYQDAINCFKKLFESEPVPDDYFAYACLKIKLGDFEEGWKYYEYRFSKSYGETAYPQFPEPKWEGQDISDKTLLVHYEQGFGDSIQFFRFLPLLNGLAKKVIFKVQDELVDLFKSNTEDVDIVKRTTSFCDLPFDYHIPIMSLPSILGTRIDTIPKGRLKADEAKIEHYKKEFFNNNCLKIGITWGGAPGGNPRRNIPLETFYPLTKLNNVKVYSFQKGIGANQLKNLPSDIEIVDLGSTFNDFSDTAAALENVDLFVTSDNSVFNLAATLGKKTFVLLNKFSEWRWFFDDETTPWYDSVTIFKKQNENDSWDLQMQRVIDTIKGL